MIGLPQSISSSIVPLVLNMLTAIECMSLNVQPLIAKVSMAMMCVASWTQAMQN